MKVRSFKDYKGAKGFPKIGQEIDCYDTQVCFGEKYYLCTYGILMLPIKEKDIHEVQEIKILENSMGQLTFNF